MKIIVEFESREEFDEHMGDDDTGVTAGTTAPKRRAARRNSNAVATTTAGTPEPAQPPAQVGQPGGFPMGAIAGAPLAAGPFGGAPVGSVPAGPSPVVMDLVNKIATRTREAVQSGQPEGPALDWFRSLCGPEAAQADFNQIMQVFMPRLNETALRDAAQKMGIPA